MSWLKVLFNICTRLIFVCLNICDTIATFYTEEFLSMILFVTGFRYLCWQRFASIKFYNREKDFYSCKWPYISCFTLRQFRKKPS